MICGDIRVWRHHSIESLRRKSKYHSKNMKYAIATSRIEYDGMTWALSISTSSDKMCRSRFPCFCVTLNVSLFVYWHYQPTLLCGLSVFVAKQIKMAGRYSVGVGGWRSIATVWHLSAGNGQPFGCVRGNGAQHMNANFIHSNHAVSLHPWAMIR